MKKIIFLAIVVILTFGYVQKQGVSSTGCSSWNQDADNTLETAFNNRQSHLQVQGEGIVMKILRDDLEGSRHQRFILKLSIGQTLLVSHNIDVAPRINELRTGDTVEFFGEYEWNSKGGVLHWTHHDPSGHHIGGWLKHKGKTYQ